MKWCLGWTNGSVFCRLLTLLVVSDQFVSINTSNKDCVDKIYNNKYTFTIPVQQIDVTMSGRIGVTYEKTEAATDSYNYS